MASTFGGTNLSTWDKISRGLKDSVVEQLTKALRHVKNAQSLNHVQGYGKFTGANTIELKVKTVKTTINLFDNAIYCCSSEPSKLPFIPKEIEPCNGFNGCT